MFTKCKVLEITDEEMNAMMHDDGSEFNGIDKSINIPSYDHLILRFGNPYKYEEYNMWKLELPDQRIIYICYYLDRETPNIEIAINYVSYLNDIFDTLFRKE